jgi:hypothetical protein
MANRLLAFFLRRSEQQNRARAIEYERARRPLAPLAPAEAHADALRRLDRAPSIAMGRLRPSLEPISVAEEIALAHAIVLGSTGSGKTRFLIGFLLDQIGRALARRQGGEHVLGFETEVIDPKAETAIVLQQYLAALWLRLNDEAREALAAAIYTIDWSRDAITPSAPFDNRAQVVSDPYKAHLLTDTTIESSRQVYSEPVRQLLYMWNWLNIDLTFPPNFAFAEKFFRDEAFRRRTLEKVGSSDVRQYFGAMKSVAAEQTQGAFLRRLHADLSFPENRYAVGVPPEIVERLPKPDDAQLVIGNYGCSNVLPLSLGLSRATWRAIGVLLDAPRRRSRTKKTILFEELALLLSGSTELMEILMTSLRTLRSVGVGLLLASQDLASSLPKNAVRNITLNTRWSATFQSRADEAELLYPHVLADPADRRTPAERHRVFLRDMQTLPRQDFWLLVKGGYPALPARSLDLPDPGRDLGRSAEDLTAIYHAEIGRRSMLTTKEAAAAITAWEGRVLGREEIAPTKNKPHQRTAGSLDELLRQLGVATNEGETDGK